MLPSPLDIGGEKGLQNSRALLKNFTTRCGRKVSKFYKMLTNSVSSALKYQFEGLHYYQ
jgi:hypothetical protein